MSTPPTFAGCQTSARGARSSGGLVVDVQTIKGDVLGSQTAAQRDRKLLLRQEGAAKERTAWGGGYISIGPHPSCPFTTRCYTTCVGRACTAS
eukprot:s456_g17.t1